MKIRHAYQIWVLYLQNQANYGNFLFVRVMQNFNSAKFWNPNISLKFWYFSPNFCMWPLNIPHMSHIIWYGVNTGLAAKWELAHRLQSPKWPPGAQNCQWGFERGSILFFLGTIVNFCQISFLIQEVIIWEKVENLKKQNWLPGDLKLVNGCWKVGCPYILSPPLNFQK